MQFVACWFVVLLIFLKFTIVSICRLHMHLIRPLFHAWIEDEMKTWPNLRPDEWTSMNTDKSAYNNMHISLQSYEAVHTADCFLNVVMKPSTSFIIIKIHKRCDSVPWSLMVFDKKCFIQNKRQKTKTFSLLHVCAFVLHLVYSHFKNPNAENFCQQVKFTEKTEQLPHVETGSGDVYTRIRSQTPDGAFWIWTANYFLLNTHYEETLVVLLCEEFVSDQTKHEWTLMFCLKPQQWCHSVLIHLYITAARWDVQTLKLVIFCLKLVIVCFCNLGFII